MFLVLDMRGEKHCYMLLRTSALFQDGLCVTAKPTRVLILYVSFLHTNYCISGVGHLCTFPVRHKKRSGIIWNTNLMQQVNFIDIFLARHISGTYALHGADGAVARHHPHRTHDPRSGSQDHHPSKNSVQKTIYCNSTSNAPDDGRMYLKHVEVRISQ